MAGIYGIVGDLSKLPLFQKTLLHHPNYSSKFVAVSNNTCIGSIDLSFKNVRVLEVDDFIIVMNGEFYLDDSMALSSPEKIYQLYLKFGDKFINLIDGIFNICIYNKKKKQFNVYNDWAGNHNLFYYYQDDYFIFSTEIKGILKIVKHKTLNKKAAVAQFMFSHLLYETTLINEVHLLPAGSKLSYSSGEVAVDKYYDLKDHYNPQKKVNVKRDIDKLYSLFEEPTKKYLHKEDISLPLTGGMDSRFLLHFMMKHNYRFKDIFTGETSRQADIDIACRICRDLNLQHRIHKLDFHEHKHEFIYNYKQSDGLLPHYLLPKTFMSIFDNNCNYVIQYPSTNMTFGDLYTPNTKNFIGDYNLNDDIVNRIIRKFMKLSEVDLDSIFTEEFTYFDKIKLELKEYLFSLKEFSSLYVFDYFGWYQHCRRWSNIGGMSGKFIGKIAPSQDKKLVEFSFNMPREYHYWQYIHKEMFKAKCPGLAKYPREGTGVPISWPQWAQAVAKAVNKKLLPKDHKINIQADQQSYYRNFVNNQIENVFNSSELSERGIFKPEGIKKIYSDHMNGKNNWYKIHNIMNLEIFIREYLN